jgi:hypothetical protein
MTESEWLTAANPDPMLDYLRKERTTSDGEVGWRKGDENEKDLSDDDLSRDRKLRLFACACCRQVWHLLPDARSRTAVEVAERYADGAVSLRELAAARARAVKAVEGPAGEAAWAAYWAASLRTADSVRNVCAAAAGAAARAAPAGDRGPAAAWSAAHDGIVSRQAELVREVFGNPFRPLAVEPAWLFWQGGTLRGLAEAIYKDTAFELLPVLADALEEAGCYYRDALEHCRKPGQHVRGCWVVDLFAAHSL